MKSNHLFQKAFQFFFLLCTIFTYAQENDILTISFSNTPLQDAIETIADKSNREPFYVADWMQDTLVTVTLENVTLDEALSSVLENTVLNYYLTEDNKIILTKNNRIYDQLPRQFFGAPTPSETTRTAQRALHGPILSRPSGRSGTSDDNWALQNLTMHLANSTHSSPLSEQKYMRTRRTP